MTRAALILAAGESKRWAGRPKHLVKLWDGETVLSRMVRQLRSHRLEPIVVARDPEILEAARGVITFTPPEQTASVFETAVVARSFWEDETALMLGDVVFTDSTLAQVVANPGSGLRIFTNPRETYAMSFGAEVMDQVETELWRQAKIASGGGKGSLRDMRGHVTPSNWAIVDDLTDDIDTPEKHELILARWGKLEAVR